MRGLASTLLTMTGVFAIMNGIVPAFAQDSAVGPGLSAEAAALWMLTPAVVERPRRTRLRRGWPGGAVNGREVHGRL